ncbi:MAG: Tn3 family transposase [Acetobacteraceae bacterium]|nr:Tn3 family transposase [Acetobacteraceae bacterium]
MNKSSSDPKFGKRGVGRAPQTIFARAVPQLRAQGITVSNDLLAHVTPLSWEHIALTGD